MDEDKLKEKLSMDLFLRIKHGLSVEKPLSVAIAPNEDFYKNYFVVVDWLENRGHYLWECDRRLIFDCLSVEEIYALTELPGVKFIRLTSETS